jgi:NADH:ubiquinone oxidoreductase subunit C
MLQNCKDITRDALLTEVASKLPMGYRFVTMTCVDAGEAFDILYHFDKNYELLNLRLRLPKAQSLPSVSGLVFAAVLVENEIKDLFGINVTGLAIDYQGHFILAEGAPTAPLLKAPPAAPAPTPAQGGK